MCTWGRTLSQQWKLEQDLDLDLNQINSHLQLHADVLSVLAEVIQGADGRLHMAAVFPVDQQPDTRTDAQISTSSLSRTSGGELRVYLSLKLMKIW